MDIMAKNRTKKFARKFGFDEYPLAKQFEYFVAANYLYKYHNNDPKIIERLVVGGGNDEGVDIAALVVNEKLVFDRDELDEILDDAKGNTVKFVFIQAKTSSKYETGRISKFLHGISVITKEAIYPGTFPGMSVQLKEVADRLNSIIENNDAFFCDKIPCEAYYVTTASEDNEARIPLGETQVSEAVERIKEFGVYEDDFALSLHGSTELSAKERERFGPMKVKFNFEKKLTLPESEGVEQAYIGLLSVDQILNLLLENGEVRPGIFEDNVRLHLGYKNKVNQKIFETLISEGRSQFPILNNGLTIIASDLEQVADRFFISGYQVVNGGQTSYQLIRWSRSDQVKQNPDLPRGVWVPVKVICAKEKKQRAQVAIATNLQNPINSLDIQASSSYAKDIEEYFAETGPKGLRYARQASADEIDFVKVRIYHTGDINKAVAAVLFGESAKAISSPKDLQSENSFVWGPYPPYVYFYAMWIVYKIERYFGNPSIAPEHAVLRAAKYHMAMMVSLVVAPEIARVFDADRSGGPVRPLMKANFLDMEASGTVLSDKIDRAIPLVANELRAIFEDELRTGRSLKKDDVRARARQEACRDRVRYIHL